MSKEAREIRDIWNDLNECSKAMKNSATVLNETYVFNKTPNQRPEPREEEMETPVNADNNTDKGSGVDEKIEQIRKIAIMLLTELDPGINPESYKLVKNIWDSCDKYLIKDTKSTKQQLNNDLN